MFNINGDDWKIILASANHPMFIRSDGSLTIGACDNNTKSIYINENLDSELMKKVLCHEITHACIFSYGIELDLMQEELLADLMATYGQEIICIANKIFCRLQEKNGRPCY